MHLKYSNPNANTDGSNAVASTDRTAPTAQSKQATIRAVRNGHMLGNTSKPMFQNSSEMLILEIYVDMECF